VRKAENIYGKKESTDYRQGKGESNKRRKEMKKEIY
jgi:hypothetical protein